MVESSLLSKDEPLTPNIDKCLFILRKQQEGIPFKTSLPRKFEASARAKKGPAPIDSPVGPTPIDSPVAEKMNYQNKHSPFHR